MGGVVLRDAVNDTPQNLGSLDWLATANQVTRKSLSGRVYSPIR